MKTSISFGSWISLIFFTALLHSLPSSSTLTPRGQCLSCSKGSPSFYRAHGAGAPSKTELGGQASSSKSPSSLPLQSGQAGNQPSRDSGFKGFKSPQDEDSNLVGELVLSHQWNKAQAGWEQYHAYAARAQNWCDQADANSKVSNMYNSKGNWSAYRKNRAKAKWKEKLGKLAYRQSSIHGSRAMRAEKTMDQMGEAGMKLRDYSGD